MPSPTDHVRLKRVGIRKFWGKRQKSTEAKEKRNFLQAFPLEMRCLIPAARGVFCNVLAGESACLGGTEYLQEQTVCGSPANQNPLVDKAVPAFDCHELPFVVAQKGQVLLTFVLGVNKGNFATMRAIPIPAPSRT